MPPNPIPGTPQEWLDRANGKLAFACQPLPAGGYFEDLCYMAQQAAELALKAVYQHHGWSFNYTHDLGQLLDGLERHGMTLPSAIQDADQLTVFATQTRYPGMGLLVDAKIHAQAAAIAQGVVQWAEAIIGGGN